MVDLLGGVGVRLPGREIQQASSVLNHGGKAGTSVKNDCKSVSSPVNCFCGDFLNTLINMI